MPSDILVKEQFHSPSSDSLDVNHNTNFSNNGIQNFSNGNDLISANMVNIQGNSSNFVNDINQKNMQINQILNEPGNINSSKNMLVNSNQMLYNGFNDR